MRSLCIVTILASLSVGCGAAPEDSSETELDFDSEEMAAGVAEQALVGACPPSMGAYRGNNGFQLTCACSSSATTERVVWGTDLYTDDSGLCKAAVHAGVIPVTGGDIVAIVQPAASSYVGSTRNGVTSNSYGYWHGSFTVQAPSSCSSNADCGKKRYCHTQAGACAQAGVCESPPDACLDIYDPVCGCDNKTYSSVCAAAAAGVSVKGHDVCGPPANSSK